MRSRRPDAAAGAADAIATPLGCWLIAAGTLLVLHVTAQRKWPEARLGIPTLAWIMLAVGLMDMRGPVASRWLSLAAPATALASTLLLAVIRLPLSTTARRQGIVARVAVVIRKIDWLRRRSISNQIGRK